LKNVNYRSVGYRNTEKHQKLLDDTSIQKTKFKFFANDIILVTEEQYVLIKLKYPDIETLSLSAFPLDFKQ